MKSITQAIGLEKPSVFFTNIAQAAVAPPPPSATVIKQSTVSTNFFENLVVSSRKPTDESPSERPSTLVHDWLANPVSRANTNVNAQANSENNQRTISLFGGQAQVVIR